MNKSTFRNICHSPCHFSFLPLLSLMGFVLILEQLWIHTPSEVQWSGKGRWLLSLRIRPVGAALLLLTRGGGQRESVYCMTPLWKHIVIAIVCNSLSLWKSLRSFLRSLQVPQPPPSNGQVFTPFSLLLFTRCYGQLLLGSLANLLLFLLFGGSGQVIHTLLSPSSLLVRVLLLEEISLPCALSLVINFRIPRCNLFNLIQLFNNRTLRQKHVPGGLAISLF